MPTIEQYFAALATTATAKLQADLAPGPAPVVFDGPQDPAATAWSSLAVHPMSVMETSYISVVEAAEAAAPNQDAAREAAFEALSGYYTLNKDTPTLLAPESEPLINDRIASIETDFRQIEVLVNADFTAAYNRLQLLVREVAVTLGMITTPATVNHASQHIQAIFAYLDMATQTTPDAVVANWASLNPGTSEVQVSALLVHLQAQIISPLIEPSIAAASPRSLYNIGPFYLYRLMHRFMGGSPDVEMDLGNKGSASGIVTGEMHRPDWGWVAKWHQDHIKVLADQIDVLNAQLEGDFMLGGANVLKFYLKGGRAMYTVLGHPDRGGNDWDTGILINPNLTPDQWYKAFAQVNDLVVSYLDKARFAYTELLSQNSAVLLDPVPVAVTHDVPAQPDDPKEYTAKAIEAEYLTDQKLRDGANLGLPAPFRPAGVNGELIDIGVSARNSVELHEHWRAVEIITVAGVGGVDTKVPKLPYYIDDFSTMIREAIETNTVGRKLAKRLERLLLVLRSDDAAFQAVIAAKHAHVSQMLPNAYQALHLDTASVASAMMVWGLDAILEDVGIFYLREAWVTALDSYLEAQSGPLQNEASIAALWATIQPSIKDHANDNECKFIFLAQNALSIVSKAVRSDYATKAATLTGVHQGVLDAVANMINGTNNQPDLGTFYHSGFAAAKAQASHQGIVVPANSDLYLGGAAEIFYRPGTVSTNDALTQLSRAAGAAIGPDYSIGMETFGTERMLVLRSSNAIAGLNITPANPALLIIRQEPDGVGAARVLDHVNGSATASLRDLSRLFVNRASRCEDHGLRTTGKRAVAYLLGDVLGRQLRQ